VRAAELLHARALQRSHLGGRQVKAGDATVPRRP
jgi:hypothetical protein